MVTSVDEENRKTEVVLIRAKVQFGPVSYIHTVMVARHHEFMV